MEGNTKHIGLVLFGLSLLLACLARAEEWSKSFSISGQPKLRVETSDANIQLDTWDQRTIEARVTTQGSKIGDDGIKIFEYQTGDSVVIEVRFPRTISFGYHRTGTVEIAIHMPREGAVDLITGDGAIHLHNFKGTREARSGDGRMEIDDADGSLRGRARRA